MGYHKRPPVKWKPLTSPYVWGESGKNLKIKETSSHFHHHNGVTTLYRIPYSKVLNGVRKGAGREHKKFADTNVVPSRRSVKWYPEVRGGGLQIAGGEDEEDSEKRERHREKRKRGGGETRHPETKAGQKPPSRLGSLVSLRDGFFRVTYFHVGSYGRLSSRDLVFLLLL